MSYDDHLRQATNIVNELRGDMERLAEGRGDVVPLVGGPVTRAIELELESQPADKGLDVLLTDFRDRFCAVLGRAADEGLGPGEVDRLKHDLFSQLEAV